MQQIRLQLFGEKLRYLDQTGALVGERTVDQAQLDAMIDELERDYHGPVFDLRAIGKKLYEWVDGAEGWFRQAREQGPVQLMAPTEKGLRALPWETLFDGRQFVCADALRPVVVVRQVSERASTVERANRPLRVLFMACSPTDASPVLDFEREEAQILEAVRAKQIELVVEESGSLRGLQERVEEVEGDFFDVLHLSGHAGIETSKKMVNGKEIEQKVPTFLVEDDRGRKQAATAEELIAALNHRWPKVIFLSGCRTGQASERGAVTSLCEALIEAGAPLVLGWSQKVSDPGASLTAAAVYQKLALGDDLALAVAHARQELKKAESSDWHLLGLYADQTPLTALVTKIKTKGREKLKVRETRSEFLDEGAQEVCARADFVGRRRVLQRCLSALKAQEGDEAYREGVLLTGMGGLGKSSLAVRLCERMYGFQRLVWVGPVDELALIAKLNGKIAGVASTLSQDNLSLKQRLGQVLDAMETPALFVFDDFEQNAENYSPEGFEVDGDNRMKLRPEPRGVLNALVEAIREQGSESRVMITCRYGFAPLSEKAGLHHEALDSLRGAGLTKKLEQLDAFKEKKADDAVLARAQRLADGNPRLLEQLSTVLADENIEADQLLDQFEAKTAEFREGLILEFLLAQQSATGRVLLARLGNFEVPVELGTIEVVHDDAPVEPHLERALALGLAESAPDGEGVAHYYVSELVKALLTDQLSEEERVVLSGRAANHLFRIWWEGKDEGPLEHALEILRLGIIAKDPAVVHPVAGSLSYGFNGQNRYREAYAIGKQVAGIGEDPGVLAQLGYSALILGESEEARRHLERAIAITAHLDQEESVKDAELKPRGSALYYLALVKQQAGDIHSALESLEQSQKIYGQIGDLQGKGASLHQMARLQAQVGKTEAAIKLLESSLEIDDQIGDLQGKGASLHHMAILQAQQGKTEAAMKLLASSLEIDDQIGDLQGKGASLHEMARLQAQVGKTEAAMKLLESSLEICDQIGDLKVKGASLHQMAILQTQVGKTEAAMKLLASSLEILDQIGDLNGKGATLSYMAGLAYESGRTSDAIEINGQVISIVAQLRGWVNLTSVLCNQAQWCDDSPQLWAQVFWLLLRVQESLDHLVNYAAGIFNAWGPKAPEAPLIAAMTLFWVQAQGAGHPEQEALLQAALQLLGACAAEAGVAPEQFGEWIEREKLNDPGFFLPKLNRLLEARIGDDWLFDLSLVEPSHGFDLDASEDEG